MSITPHRNNVDPVERNYISTRYDLAYASEAGAANKAQLEKAYLASAQMFDAGRIDKEQFKTDIEVYSQAKGKRIKPAGAYMRIQATKKLLNYTSKRILANKADASDLEDYRESVYLLTKAKACRIENQHSLAKNISVVEIDPVLTDLRNNVVKDCFLYIEQAAKKQLDCTSERIVTNIADASDLEDYSDAFLFLSKTKFLDDATAEQLMEKLAENKTAPVVVLHEKLVRAKSLQENQSASAPQNLVPKTIFDIEPARQIVLTKEGETVFHPEDVARIVANFCADPDRAGLAAIYALPNKIYKSQKYADMPPEMAKELMRQYLVAPLSDSELSKSREMQVLLYDADMPWMNILDAGSPPAKNEIPVPVYNVVSVESTSAVAKAAASGTHIAYVFNAAKQNIITPLTAAATPEQVAQFIPNVMASLENNEIKNAEALQYMRDYYKTLVNNKDSLDAKVQATNQYREFYNDLKMVDPNYAIYSARHPKSG